MRVVTFMEPEQHALDAKRIKQEQVTETIDKLFTQLKSACPAMFYTFTHHDEVAIKRQWVIGFIENGINKAMLNAGMRIARRQSNPFMPSVGQFIKWCEKGLIEQYALPTPLELVNKLDKYCLYRGFNDINFFDNESDAIYWLVTDLYQTMQDEQLNKTQLLKRADKIILALAKNLMNGYIVPSPKYALAKKVKTKPLSQKESLSRIKDIKHKFGFKIRGK